MSLGLLAALTGFVEGRGEAYDSKKELLTAADKVKQSASNERLKTKFGKAIKKYDLLEKDNEDAIHSGVESSRAQWILSGRRADGVAEKDYKSTDRTSDKVYGLHILGDKPELDYLDATNFRAPQASFISSLAYQDGDKYTGGTMAQEESSRYNLSNVRAGSRQATQEQMTNVTARRELEYDLGKSLPMYQSLVKNISEMPKLEEAMLKLPEGSRDHFLRTVAKFTGVTEDDVTISQATERALSLFDKAPTDVTASTATDDSLTSNKLTSLQSTLSTLNAELGSEIRTRSDSTIKKEIKAAEASIQTERNNITARKKRNEKLTDTRNQNISSYNQKLATYDTKGKISRMSQEAYTVIPGLSSDMLADKDGVPTHAFNHINKGLTDMFPEIKEAILAQVKANPDLSVDLLAPDNILNQLGAEAKNRTVMYDSMTGDAILLIPSDLVPVGAGYNAKVWEADLQEYMDDAASFWKGDDDAQQEITEYLKEIRNGLRPLPGTGTMSTAPEVKPNEYGGFEVMEHPTKGKIWFNKETKQFKPYGTPATNASTEKAVTTNVPAEPTMYESIAALKLKAHNESANIRKQASIDMQAATSAGSKAKISDAAGAAMDAIQEKLTDDLNNLTNK